jgi:probable HAF family extracellular repeat protein
MIDLGVLPDYEMSIAWDVSADGLVVVGNSTGVLGGTGFRWTLQEGMVPLTGIPVTDVFSVHAVSGDGRVIVGTISDAANGGANAARWTAGGGVSTLGYLSGDDFSEALDTNYDGSVIVGTSEQSTIEDSQQAFRWTQGSGMTNLGVLPGGRYALAYGVSSSGDVVVGTSDSSNGSRAFRWTELIGMQDLGVLPGWVNSDARGVSADGKVVVGTLGDGVPRIEDETTVAFRWTESGGFETLGVLPGYESSLANDVNADGSVVVGSSSIEGVSKRAYRWTKLGGMEDLGVLDGYESSVATAVSADGLVVVGYSDVLNKETGEFKERAFIWRGVIQDYSNLIASFSGGANSTSIALQQSSDLLTAAVGTGCEVTANHSYCMRLTGAASTYDGLSRNGNWEDAAQALGSVALGFGVASNVTLGFILSSTSGTDTETVKWNDPNLSIAAYAKYTATGDYRTGLTLEGRAGLSSGNIAFVRANELSDVQKADGDADVQTSLAMFKASYGFEVSDSWVLSPTASIMWSRSTRDSYSESESLAFYAEYDGSDEESFSVILGVDQHIELGERHALQLGAGGVFDLSYQEAVLTGTSNVPGMDSFTFHSNLDRHDLRGYANLEHQFALDDNLTWTTQVYAVTPTYGNDVNFGGAASLRISF